MLFNYVDSTLPSSVPFDDLINWGTTTLINWGTTTTISSPEYTITYKELAEKMGLTTKEEKNMKTLYNIIVVTREEEIIMDKKVIAKDTIDAKFLAGVFKMLEQKKLTPSDVSIFVTTIGLIEIK